MVQVLPKLIVTDHLPAVLFFKIMGYFLKFLPKSTPAVYAACQNCLEYLFTTYFSMRRADRDTVIEQLFAQISVPHR